MIYIYTDGSCSNNPGPGGFGVIVIESIDKTLENSWIKTAYQKRCEKTTNNREELKAILWALIKFGKGNSTPIVYTDSAYAVNTLTKWMYGWEKKGWLKIDNRKPENLDLIQAYFDLEQQGYHIVLEKVKGHAGIEFNEIADGLATGKIDAASLT